MNSELGGVNSSWDRLCARVARPYPPPHHMSDILKSENCPPPSHLAGMVAYLN
jgi:hypothetical protein